MSDNSKDNEELKVEAALSGQGFITVLPPASDEETVLSKE